MKERKLVGRLLDGRMVLQAEKSSSTTACPRHWIEDGVIVPHSQISIHGDGIRVSGLFLYFSTTFCLSILTQPCPEGTYICQIRAHVREDTSLNLQWNFKQTCGLTYGTIQIWGTWWICIRKGYLGFGIQPSENSYGSDWLHNVLGMPWISLAFWKQKAYIMTRSIKGLLFLLVITWYSCSGENTKADSWLERSLFLNAAQSITIWISDF